MKPFRSWTGHFFLNLGAALACLRYAILPPWSTGHGAESLERFATLTPRAAFLDGWTAHPDGGEAE